MAEDRMQKLLAQHKDATEQKQAIDIQFESLAETGSLNFNALPSDLGQRLRQNCMKEMHQESIALNNEITELSLWVDTCIEKENRIEKEIEETKAKK